MIAFTNPALAGTVYDEAKAIDDALQNYGSYYIPFSQEVPGQDQSLHYITDTSLSKIPDANGYGCGFLTYGQPHGDYKDGQHRYIGYIFYGEDYTNMDFPPDRYANGADFASQNWVAEPWKDPDVKASNPQLTRFPGDGDSDIGYRYILQYSIGFTDFLGNNGYKVDLSSNPSFWDNIHQYVHILSPATTYSWGIGRMWHKDAAGNLWYITIPIAPSILIPPPGNLKAVSLDLGVPAGQKAEPGAEYTATVVFENESDQPYPGTPVAVLHGDYQATLYDENGQVLPKKTVGGREVQVADFGKKGEPNARRTFTCKWHPFGQAKDGLTGVVNRDEIGKVHLETTYEDNIVRAETEVTLPDFYVTIDPHEAEADPGQELSFTAAYGLKDTAAAPAKAYLKAFHVVNGTEYAAGVTLEGMSIAPDQLVEFQPGEEKMTTVTVHAQEIDSQVVVRIEPEAGDVDLSDNEDEATVTIRP